MKTIKSAMKYVSKYTEWARSSVIKHIQNGHVILKLKKETHISNKYIFHEGKMINVSQMKISLGKKKCLFV